MARRLPGRNAVLATERDVGAALVVVDLETGARTPLGLEGTYPRYAPTGHLLFARDGFLYGVPFDIDRLQVRGAPVPLREGVRNPNRGGRVRHLPPPLRFQRTARARPGRRQCRSALGIARGHAAVYVMELDTGVRRLVSTGAAFLPVWSPCGSRLYFTRERGLDVVDISREGELRVGASRRLSMDANLSSPPRSIHPDGERLLANMSPGGLSQLDTVARIHVVLNWFEELKRAAPTRSESRGHRVSRPAASSPAQDSIERPKPFACAARSVAAAMAAS